MINVANKPNASRSTLSKTGTTSDDERRVKECRICFSNQDNYDNPLTNPCACRGTMTYVHEQCIIRWFTEKRKNRCELCKQLVKMQMIFTVRRLIAVIKEDIAYLIERQDITLKLFAQGVCLAIYLRHFLTTVRFLRTKMLRNLCKLWVIFEQEEKLRHAYKYTNMMKFKQVLSQEIPLTIRLLAFMWILRNFVSVGAKYLLKLAVYVWDRYLNAKELRLVIEKDQQPQQPQHFIIRQGEIIDDRIL